MVHISIVQMCHKDLYTWNEHQFLYWAEKDQQIQISNQKTGTGSVDQQTGQSRQDNNQKLGLQD